MKPKRPCESVLALKPDRRSNTSCTGLQLTVTNSLLSLGEGFARDCALRHLFVTRSRALPWHDFQSSDQPLTAASTREIAATTERLLPLLLLRQQLCGNGIVRAFLFPHYGENPPALAVKIE